MKSKTTEHSPRKMVTAPFILFTLDLFVRTIYLLNTDNNFFGDATARLETIQWQTLGLSLLPHSDWLPIPFWISGFFTSLFDDIFYTPRIVSTLFGSLCVFNIFFLTSRLFNRASAILASLMFTFSIQILAIESITLSEPFFHFFSLSLINLFFLKKRTYLIKGFIALMAICLCLTRLEGWFLCGLLFFLSLRKKDYSFSIPIFLGAGVGVLYWEIASIILGNGFLRAILFSDLEVRNMYKTNGFDNFEIFWRSILGFTMLSFLPLIFGYFIVKKDKLQREFFIISILFLLPAVLKIINKTLFCEFRYFTIYAITMMPITAYFISEKAKTLSRPFKFLTLIFFFILAITVDYHAMKSRFGFKKHTQLNPGFLESAKYLKSKPDLTNKIVYVDFDQTWDRELWTVYSSMNQKRPYKYCRVESHSWMGEHFSKDSLNDCFSEPKETFLVLFPEGTLNSFYNNNKQYFRDTFKHINVKNFGQYKVINLIP